MLRDGQFIKEEPPRIGSCYTPFMRNSMDTKEEWFMQDILLNADGTVKAPIWARVLGKLLRV